MRRLLLAVTLLLAPSACDKETGKGAETKAGEGARAGAPVGENVMIDAGPPSSGGVPGTQQR